MSKELITYKKFNDAALANELTEVLQKHGINYRVDEESTLFNPTFYADETAKDYAVKIDSKDFVRANELLKAEEAEIIDKVNKDHYLFDFTDEELKDLVSKPDEWSSFDNLLAVKILKERGIGISSRDISELNQLRLDELRQPEPSQTFWIVIGYIVAFLGGVLGLFIGWHLSTYKKTLPNGDLVFGYGANDRQQGKRILYISIVMIAVTLGIRIFAMF